MNRIVKAYAEILHVFFQTNRFIVIFTFISAIVSGLIVPLSVWLNGQIFNIGMGVAAGTVRFLHYIPYLVAFLVFAILPVLIGDLFINSCILPQSRLILRSELKGKMLQKLKKIRYEHLESSESLEIIEKTYARAEDAALELFPTSIQRLISTGFASVGILYLIGSVKWWLLLVLLIPFLLETWLLSKSNRRAYDQMEQYWKKERGYSLLGGMLRSRDHIRENYLFGSSDYLINTYQKRMGTRNREYERFYLKHLRRNFGKQIITKTTQLASAFILLYLYSNGKLSIGLLISLTMAIFMNLFSAGGLSGFVQIVRNAGQHINTYILYDSYFELSEDKYGDEDFIHQSYTIEFKDVWFTYPGSKKEVLRGLSFRIEHGEKVSIVGENGEGKSTVMKLLLGLFAPDKGEILVGGKPLASYSQAVRSRMFGTVFQDFSRYSIPFSENVGIGDIDEISNGDAIDAAIQKAKADRIVMSLSDGKETLLGRDFEDGIDLSGGQWQRIAMARAFMGDKPILILDEPTSQLDPIAESEIYSDFAEISRSKTSVFITHRLASTKMVDRIFVIAGGVITQSGSHEELMKQGGLYAQMFDVQKQWYVKETGVTDNAL